MSVPQPFSSGIFCSDYPGLALMGEKEEGELGEIKMVPLREVDQAYVQPGVALDGSFVAWDRLGWKRL